MRFPIIATRKSLFKKHKLSPRAGGGGGGRGWGSAGGRAGNSCASSCGRSGGAFGSRSGSGGTASFHTVPDGQLFAGRTEGGGRRSQIYGTREYGSGYPGITGRGVSGRGFPFYFWPVVWGGAAGAGGAAYLHSTEYGSPYNSSRPGGPLMTATFVSSTALSTFGLVSDNATVVALIQEVTKECGSEHLNTLSSSKTPRAYVGSPRPESVIQYYRASSVALTLEGYNNSAALLPDEGRPDTPLPPNVDTTLMNCLNQTIGDKAPLDSGAEARCVVPKVGLIALLWILLHLASVN